MIDCSHCDLPSQPLTVIPTTCQQSGPQVFHPATTSNAGTKQIPLLHLVYELCVNSYAPQAREGRKTWLAVKYSQTTGNALTPPKYTVTADEAKTEARQLIGMLLAQRAHFLPIWAQLGQAQQLEIAGAIAALLKGEPLQSDLLSRLQFEMLKGSAHLALQNAAQELAKGLEIARQRCASIAGQIEIMNARRAKANERIDELNGQLNELSNHYDAVGRQFSQSDFNQGVARSQLNPDLLEPDGSPTGKETLRQFIFDAYPGQEALFNDYVLYGNEKAQLQQAGQHLQQSAQALIAERDHIANIVKSGEALYDDLEKALLDFTLLQLEHNNMSEFAVLTQKEARKTVQLQALQDDYALQSGNYVDPQLCVELRSILESSLTAVTMFLYLHPNLKYSGDSKVACRIRKFLASPLAQQAFQALDDVNLIQPGPFAKLGVFVINALTPGSYDQRHRDMVQKEIEIILNGMAEHGMNPEICCHSCGTTRVSGMSQQDESTDWIRDHNPPTALYSLGPNIYRRLGLNDYNGNGVINGQILLPQCRECSKKQGSVVSNAVDVIQAVTQVQWLDPNFNLLTQLQQQLSPNDWNDFQRLVCNPMAGWSTPNDLSATVANHDLSQLVVTGIAGSFAGSDNTILKALGAQVGCHTCIDVAVQNDPYRNIYWIADHQPPTALVARGLMELPQVVYPHGWNCSETQSKMVAHLCKLFESCFGKGFKTQWVQQIKDQAWQGLSS